jgi:hypothetical protein
MTPKKARNKAQISNVTETSTGSVSAGVGPRGLIRRSRRHTASLFAALFALVMVAIPWPTIWLAQYGRPMEDRRVYSEQIASGYLSFDVGGQGDFWDYVSSEYLWGWLLNLLVREWGLSVVTTFGLISAFVVFIAGQVIARHAHPAFVLLLVNPIFVNLAFSQLRIALAVSLVCVAYLLGRSSAAAWAIRLSLLAAACLVHTSMIVFVGLFIFALWVARTHRSRPYQSFMTLTVGGLLAVGLLGPLRSWFLSEIGDRRADADYLSSSVNFYLIWLIVAFLLTLSWREIRIDPSICFALACLVVVLAGVFFDVYVNRVIAIALPFLVVAISKLPQTWRPFALIAYLAHSGAYWLYWLRLY